MKPTYHVINTKQRAPLDVDLKAGVVKVVWSTMEMEDYDEEGIAAGAWNKTIMERGPSGSNLIAALIDHHPSVSKMYGKPSELYVENNELIAVIPVVKTELGKDIMIQYAAGLINQQSAGFASVREEMRNNRKWFLENKLYEGSAVLWGANWMTPTLEVIRTAGKAAALADMTTQEQIMSKAVRTCDFTDDTHILLEIQLKQLQQAIQVAQETPEENNLEVALKKLLSSIS